MKTIEENKAEFINLLKSTNRDGIDAVLQGLEVIGFYSAPASSKFHCDYEGGLLEHSLNVYRQAKAICAVEKSIRPDIETKVKDDSIVIVALLHDVCKADIYKKVEKFRKDKDGRWEKYYGWDVDHGKMPLGHGEKSVIRLLRMGLKLTNDEIVAIRRHMGAWDLSEYSDAKGSFNSGCDNVPLLPILMAADGLASRITELPTAGAYV